MVMDLVKREQLFKLGYYNLDRNENLDKIYLSQLDNILKKHTLSGATYPDYPAFINRISSFFRISQKEVIPTCGCTEAIKVVMDAFVSSGTEVLVLEPTYESAVSHLKTLDASIHSLPYNTPMDEIVSYLKDKRIRFFYLCNSNNPTGTVYSFEDLAKLVKSKAIIFMDESYFEFCDVTALPLIFHSPNIIIGRSFSKAWGLAGLRAGLLISNEEMIRDLTPLKLKASVNSIAVKVITEIMNNYNLVADSVKRIKAGNKYIRDNLIKNGISIDNDIHGNFILAGISTEELDTLRVLYKTVGDKVCISAIPVEQAEAIFKFQQLVSP